MEDNRLSEVILASVAGESQATLSRVADLEGILVRILEECRLAWPSLRVDPQGYVRHIAHHLPKSRSEGTAGVFEGLHATDLYLAFACAEGETAAIAAFDKTLAREISVALSRMVPSRSEREDIGQMVRERLLVSSANRPKIADYSGRGPLTGWLRVALIRTAVSLARRKEPRSSLAESALADLPAALGDPELDHIRDRYQEDFKLTFQAALSSLSAQDRTILRLNLVDGLNIEQIGVIYRVHRSTVARWIARSREAVQAETRRLLAERLRLNDREFDSLVGVLRSDLDLSIQRILQRGEET